MNDSIYPGIPVRLSTWQPSLGNTDVRVAFKNKTHDLNVSTLALVILLLFEGVGDDGFLTLEVRQLPWEVTGVAWG